jgi:hypothetical protein
VTVTVHVGSHGLVVKLEATPVGSPEAVKVTAVDVPLTSVAVMDEDGLVEPCSTDRVLGEGVERLKSNGAGGLTWNVMSAVVCESVPIVPVTVSVKSVGLVTVPVQERVAVCGVVPNVTLGAMLQVSPEGVEDEADRLMVPVSALSASIVIVCVIELPLFPVTVTGVSGEMLKSTTWNTMLVICTRAVLTESLASKRTDVSPTPVLVQVSVTVCGEDPKVTGLGLVQVTPFGKFGDALKLTVPV